MNDPVPGTNQNGPVEDLWVDFVLLFISIFRIKRKARQIFPTVLDGLSQKLKDSTTLIEYTPVSLRCSAAGR
jgi:hypothetical protein